MENLEYILNVLDGKETFVSSKIDNPILAEHIENYISLMSAVDEINEAVEKIEDLEEQLDSRDDDVSDLENQIEDLEERIEELEPLNIIKNGQSFRTFNFYKCFNYKGK